MRSLVISLGLILSAVSVSAQSPGQPPFEACKPGDFTVIGYPDEFGPKADSKFIVRINNGFVDRFLTRDSIWIPSINSAVERYNGLPGSKWVFDNRGLTEKFADFADGEVTIAPCGGLFACPTEPPPVLPPGPPVPDFANTVPANNTVIAVTLISSDGGSGNNIGDSDIFFNPALPLSPDPQSGQIDFESVLVHELGHALGLDHNDNCVVGPTIMESLIDTEQIKRDLFAAEIEGVRFLYPADTTIAIRVFDRDRALRFDAAEGGRAPFEQQVFIYGPGGSRWIPSVSADWVRVSPQAGTFPKDGTIEISVAPGSLAPGRHDATVSLNLEGHPGPPARIAVSLFIAAGPEAGDPPFLTRAGVTNGANLRSSRLSGGSLFTVFGISMAATVAQATSIPLPTTLGGVQVLINGVPAPLLYASANQVNGQIPPETALGAGSLVVRNGFGDSGAVSIQIDPEAPELFLTGGDDGLILNQDLTVNSISNPAPAGTTVSVFFTGQGAVAPPVAAGRPAPASPLSQVIAFNSAEIDGQETTVQFLGLAPGYIGLGQGNIGVPAGVSGRVSLRIRIGESWSNTGFLYVE
jgi:uncharacterized protein (TIGR03437 family)